MQYGHDYADSSDIPQNELDGIYENQIRPDYVDAFSASPSKHAVLIGGQPGSGKSSIKSSLAMDRAGGYVSIDADDLREYVPSYKERARSIGDAQLAASWSHKATQHFTQRLLDDALAKGTNVVIDATLSNPEKSSELVNRLHNAGYEVDVNIICTNRSLSERSIHERYFYDKHDAQVEDDIIPRYVPPEIHREAVKGFTKSVDDLEQKAAANSNVSLHLWERAKEIGLPAIHVPFEPGTAVETLQKTQDKQLSKPEQVREHFESWNNLASTITASNSRATLAEIRDTSEIYSEQHQRHDIQSPDSFKALTACLLALDNRLSAEGEDYRASDTANSTIDIARNKASERLATQEIEVSRNVKEPEQYLQNRYTPDEPSR